VNVGYPANTVLCTAGSLPSPHIDLLGPMVGMFHKVLLYW